MPVGTRRVGTLVDFDPTTPHGAAVLERSDEKITLTVIWHDFKSPYAGWFGHGPGPNGSVQRSLGTRIPRVLLFQDPNGSVLLVGCRNAGFTTDMFGPGAGTINAEYAVLGVRENCDFSSAKGVESEISGLREWLRVSSVGLRIDSDGGTGREVVTLESAPLIEVGGSFGLAFRPAARVSSRGSSDEWKIHDQVFCLTTSSTRTSVEEHLRHHRAVRDLLVIARWWPEVCLLRRAAHPGAPLRSIDGDEHGPEWFDIVVSPERPPERPRQYREDLIRFDEIGVEGILRWLRLRDEFARALGPVVATRDLDVNFPATYLAQVGPGLEALGYLLLRRDGVSRNEAKNTDLRPRLERVLTAVGDAAPVNPQTWAQATAAAYNGVKHANRRLPNVLDVLNTWRESVLVVRAWVALELGVAPADVKRRLKQDPQAHPWVSA